MVRDFFSRLFKFQEEPAAQPEAPLFVPMASTGTEIYSGYIHEDHLQTLRGYERAKVFDKMRRSDSQVRMLLSAVKNPIRSATWEVHPTDDSAEAQADADLIKYLLFDHAGKSFKRLLGEILTMIDFGYSTFEKVYSVDVNDPVYGAVHTITGVHWISPKTVHRFNVERDTGKLVSISQFAYGDLEKTIDVPAKYLLHFVLEQEGANYEGLSWLRAVYGNYLRKNEYMKLNAIGIEKFAIPTPAVKVPPGLQNSPSYQFLLEALEVYTSGEANYITYPSEYEIEWASNGQYHPDKVDMAVDAEDRRMTKAFLANFLELGQGSSTGSFALGRDLSDFFLGGLVYVANEICDTINNNLIPELMLLNRGPRKVYPKLRHSGIDDKAGKELAEVLANLAQHKYIIPDDMLEDNLRKRYSLPPRSEEGKREQAPAPQPFGLSERVRKKLLS